MKKPNWLLIVCIIGLGLLFPGCPGGDTEDEDNGGESETGKLMIFQVYGTGMSGGAGANRSFVELYNSTNSPINLDGYSLWFANGIDHGAGKAPNPPTAPDTEWLELELANKTIPAKGSFLILGPEIKTATTRFIIPANYGDINNEDFVLSNRAFKVALIKGTTALDESLQNPFDADGNGTKVPGYIDMVGAKNTQDRDQIRGYETAPARNSASEGVRRKDLDDTDDNSVDFIAARYAADGFTNEMLEVRRPRNSSAGTWDPFMEPGPPLPPSAGTQMLMILQIGAATDGNLSRSFVELYNNTSIAIDLSGYSLQYAFGFSTNAGNGNPGGDFVTDGSWAKIDLTGTIQPRHSFLILGPKETTGASDSPPALVFENDSYGDMYRNTFKLNNRAVKVALMSNTTQLTVQNPFDTGGGVKVSGYVDMVGAINTAGTDYINGFETANIGNLNKQAGQRRKTLDDTDNNADDFERATFANMVTKSDGVITAYTEEYEIKRPKNHAYGPWHPISGEKF